MHQYFHVKIFIFSTFVNNKNASQSPETETYIKLLECPIPPPPPLSSSVTKNLGHVSSCCISLTWSNGFLQSF